MVEKRIPRAKRFQLLSLALLAIPMTLDCGKLALPESDPPIVLEEQPTDNGPAILRALLLGFGIDVPTSSLRSRLNTDETGTSIDDVEAVAIQLGLRVDQQLVPAEHVTLVTSRHRLLPAIGIVNGEGSEGLRFLLIWRAKGDKVQVMDTKKGSFWLTKDELKIRLYRHDISVPKDAWTEYSVSVAFLDPIRQRILDLGASNHQATTLTRRAQDVPGCGPAALDAVARWQEDQREPDVVALDTTFSALLAGRCESQQLLPETYWFVTPDNSNHDAVYLHGALIVTR